MDSNQFKKILSTFSDARSDGVVLRGGTLLVQVLNEVIEASVANPAGSLVVTEGGVERSAEEWIVHRVAMLDLLAERIISTFMPSPAFVSPRGSLLGAIEASPTDIGVAVSDCRAAVIAELDRRPVGTCSVLYLTSDAGEGKTTLINYLAFEQARRFRARETQWLLVPIALGGRTFLRFDDVVVATLMNQLRFPRLYFDSFIHLVRLGFLVPALDGFEELFVETTEGDAVSSLGTLITQLQGEGTLLIAARRAYFEFRGLRTQARLLDAIPEADVTFSRLRLERWDRPEFLKYANLSGIHDPEALYSTVEGRVGASHPLLTRAVLVSRLVELIRKSGNTDFLQDIKPETDAFFTTFIDKLLEREVFEKWIDRSGDPPRPLLSVQGHRELLSDVAEEMWISKTAALPTQIIDSLVDLYCESTSKPPAVSRQVRERLKQHALITTVGSGGKTFSFDHDDFRLYFLSERIGKYLAQESRNDLRKLLRMEALPRSAMETAVAAALRFDGDPASALETVVALAQIEGPSSFVRENAGTIATYLLEKTGSLEMVVQDLVFPVDALQSVALSEKTFRSCHFRSTSLEHSSLISCRFENCEFERLEVNGPFDLNFVVLDAACKVHCIAITTDDDTVEVYDPSRITAQLYSIGILVETPQQLELVPYALPDLDLQIAQKVFATFQRATQVTEGTFRLRLSVNASRFFDKVLPDLLRTGVLERSRREDKFKLGAPLGRMAAILEESGGSYERFIAAVERR